MPLTRPGPCARALALAVVAVQATSFAPSRAGADAPIAGPDQQKLRCAKAYELGQRARKAGQLVTALEQLRQCAAPTCPSFVRDDCGRWSDEVSASVPTIVLSATTARGGDLLDVAVSIDGAPLLERLDGKALPIDPGTHLLRFEHEGSAAIEQRIVVHEGEKLRVVSVTFGPAAKGVAVADDGAQPAGATTGRARAPVGAWVLGAVGLASLGGFAYFASRGLGQKHDLDGCKPGCDPGDVDAARRSFLIGDVFLGVGVAALAGAVVVYAVRPQSVDATASIGVAPALGGATALLQGSF